MGPTRMLLAKPVIAAVEGHAVAGGLELAVWCDLRVAATDAVFGVYCRRWGVPLVDGGTIRLPRLIGHSHALDLILTGRGVGGRRGAARWGWSTGCVEPGEALADGGRAGRARSPRFPQGCLRTDRRSSLRAVGAADSTTRWRARPSSASRRSAAARPLDGAARFAAGAGRHGASA